MFAIGIIALKDCLQTSDTLCRSIKPKNFARYNGRENTPKLPKRQNQKVPYIFWEEPESDWTCEPVKPLRS